MNKVQLIGRMGRDADMTYTPTGTAVTKTSLAVSRKYGKGDQRKEETTWFSLTAFEKLAETMNQYCKKGDQLYVEGRVSARAYKDKNGEPACSLDVVVERIEMLGNKKDDAATPAGVASGDGVPTGEDFPF